MGRLVRTGGLSSSSRRAQSRRVLASLPAAEVGERGGARRGRRFVFACDGQSGDETDVGVGFHEADEVGAGNGFDGAGERVSAVTRWAVARAEAARPRMSPGPATRSRKRRPSLEEAVTLTLTATNDQEVIGG